MQIGILRIELFISNAGSLKDKRAVIKALKERIRNNFNVSISEVDGHEKWQRSTLGIATVGTDTRYVNGTLDKALDLVRKDHGVSVTDFQLEIL